MNSRGTGMVGYNVQSAVDSQHHLIIAHKVTTVGSDRSQLAHVAKQAKETLQAEALDVAADRGYYNGDEIRACERLIYRFTRTEERKDIRRYWSSACPRCPIKAQCTTGDNRRVSRWVHADVLDRA